MNLKKNIKRNDDWRLIKNESKERNTILRLGMEYMTRTSTRLSSQSNLKSRVECKNRLWRKRRRSEKRRQRRCSIMQRLSRKCIGLRFPKRSDDRSKLIELSWRIETRSFDLLVKTDKEAMKDLQAQTIENTSQLIGKTWEILWNLQQKSYENDINLNRSTT